jgi:hypothetical protein
MRCGQGKEGCSFLKKAPKNSAPDGPSRTQAPKPDPDRQEQKFWLILCFGVMRGFASSRRQKACEGTQRKDVLF